jgi:hypothetical protein
MRAAYCVRIQSSLKRLGTRSATTAGPSSSQAHLGSGSERIQVSNCCGR